MNGLRIGKVYIGHQTTNAEQANASTINIDDNRSDFSAIFQPIKSYFDNYYWLFFGVRFDFPREWRYYSGLTIDEVDHIETATLIDQVIIGESEKILYTKPQFLARYSDYMESDWSKIYGFTNPIDDPEDFLHIHYNEKSKKRFAELGNSADIMFFCSAAVFWEILSKDEEHLITVFNYLRKNRIENGKFSYQVMSQIAS